MKFFAFITIVILIASCNRPNKEAEKMQATIDSLQKQLKETYKPGLGEFMTGIQTHHAKLWFAGQNQNWPLADFEVHEILESLDDIQAYCTERSEIKAIGMIKPPLDSINNAIQQKNLQQFTSSFTLLTNTCNTCHKATDHGFNVVIIPTSLPVVNQDFKPIQQEAAKKQRM
ncbi:MAG: hypothetical protein Q8941_14285 [Bacteroidota bacterium]|nr:hypothetical protein [Bacteroidota bacterium]